MKEKLMSHIFYFLSHLVSRRERRSWAPKSRRGPNHEALPQFGCSKFLTNVIFLAISAFFRIFRDLSRYFHPPSPHRAQGEHPSNPHSAPHACPARASPANIKSRDQTGGGVGNAM